MAWGRSGHGLVAVAGGLLAVAGDGGDGMGTQVLPDGLYDEASGQWFELPHLMTQLRVDTSVVSLPAAALAPRAAAATTW